MDSKRFIIVIGIVTLIVLTVLLGRYLSAGKLIVNTTPSGATIEINKNKYTSPATIKLIKGTYNILVSKDGYINETRKVSIKSKKTIILDINLVDLKNTETINPHVLEAILKSLPFENDNVRIIWNNSKAAVEIIPKIPWGNDFPPETYFQNNWEDYNNFGKEGLQLLEDKELGKQYRDENNIGVLWWGQEWWPENVNTPSL